MKPSLLFHLAQSRFYSINVKEVVFAERKSNIAKVLRFNTSARPKYTAVNKTVLTNK
ncbi:2446_t:CDS:1, partial [Gigaspora rosea]